VLTFFTVVEVIDPDTFADLIGAFDFDSVSGFGTVNRNEFDIGFIVHRFISCVGCLGATGV